MKGGFALQLRLGTRARTTKDIGGLRYRLHSLLEGRRFERLHIDIGIGDPLLAPVEYLETPALLAFAGIEPTVVPCYPVTQ